MLYPLGFYYILLHDMYMCNESCTSSSKLYTPLNVEQNYTYNHDNHYFVRFTVVMYCEMYGVLKSLSY